MAFGQPSGPPASRRQIEELEALLGRAGFGSFREARHPYGLTQRQAAGKFSVAEADELLERLHAAELVQGSAESGRVDDGPSADAPVDAPADRAPAARGASRDRGAASSKRAQPRKATTLGSLGDEVLVAELERRGWCCIPPLKDG